MMFFVPNSSIKRISSAEAPSLIDNMQITAATPKMMPSEVSSDRSLCSHRLFSPNRKVSRLSTFMFQPRLPHGIASALNARPHSAYL